MQNSKVFNTAGMNGIDLRSTLQPAYAVHCIQQSDFACMRSLNTSPSTLISHTMP